MLSHFYCQSPGETFHFFSIFLKLFLVFLLAVLYLFYTFYQLFFFYLSCLQAYVLHYSYVLSFTFGMVIFSQIIIRPWSLFKARRILDRGQSQKMQRGHRVCHKAGKSSGQRWTTFESKVPFLYNKCPCFHEIFFHLYYY